MSLLPEGASFEELVQDYFLAVRGAGLMLSALDAQLLVSWAEAKVPFEVVARGIARSAEKAQFDARPGEPLLRSLRACRRQVDAEIRRYLQRAAGGTGTEEPESGAGKRKAKTWEETRHLRLRATLAQLAVEAPALTERVALLLERVLVQVPEEPSQADRQEALAFALLLRAMPWRNRRALWREAQGDPTSQAGLSARSRRLSRRFRLIALVRRRLGLTEL
ncbi:hypothetical protein FGE12_08850 [Aggregicoccus sp. 17bor-14]|uniref:hypothetical protein n=1 Tax=Myxococcaceae TaxID=31 RepID=UPI00129D1362|nr:MULTISPECIES: hypothetical protein [Myxococcaceae]MBF5042507.1 hypothetical protein [Simulacricoccus sp. 17bor-14]MRI88277.1 hypothetical protein [Aggregicoccus sp. 17bor-14]